MLTYFDFQGNSLICDTWPSQYSYPPKGCTRIGSWTLLDKKTVSSTDCELLCRQHASASGCCFVDSSHGCLWKAEAKSDVCYGCTGLATDCFLGENLLFIIIIIKLNCDNIIF